MTTQSHFMIPIYGDSTTYKYDLHFFLSFFLFIIAYLVMAKHYQQKSFFFNIFGCVPVKNFSLNTYYLVLGGAAAAAALYHGK